jgi:acyl-CoA thioester hydrolase
MSAGPRLLPTHAGAAFSTVARVRVLYADTDAMAVVYHGTYLRWLEHGRVELMRRDGVRYAELERAGIGLPVTELAVQYLQPARYDDLVTVSVAVLKFTSARLHFGYRLTVEPGDRQGTDGAPPLEILRGESRHACVRLADGRATRLPDAVVDRLRSCYTSVGG